MSIPADKGHHYYGVELFLGRNQWMSTLLFPNKKAAGRYGEWALDAKGADGFKIHTFQLQQEHVQD